MDQQLLQRTRYLLQTRFRKLRTTPAGNFELVAQQILTWLEQHPIIGSVIHHLEQVRGEHHQEVRLIVESNISSTRYYQLTVANGSRQEGEPEFTGYTPSSLEEHASACLLVLKACIEKASLEFNEVLAVYLTQEIYSYRTRQNKDSHDAIKDIAVRDLYEYLDENLDGIYAVNGLLRKYKQNIEWFQREHIHRILQEGYGGKAGERALALHLQQYIFDQGVEFIVEPSSVSGEADLLLRDPSGQYLIADAKLIRHTAPPSEIIRKISEGFNQVARYCNDYSQPEGFLVVFVNDDISILLDIEQDVFRYFRIGGHVIYYIQLNISERPSASKSGKARQVHITKDMFFKEIEELGSQS